MHCKDRLTHSSNESLIHFPMAEMKKGFRLNADDIQE